MKNKSSNRAQSVVNYTRSKDAYDGNMELTNLKSSSQKLSSVADSLPDSTIPKKDKKGD